MFYDRLNQRPITNPHLLSKNALKVLAGKPVLLVTDDDYENIMQYFERLTIVDKIVENAWENFKLA